jgi:hypothetical protein
MKEQDNHSSSKANYTIKDLNKCVKEEMSNNEFQTILVKMINKLQKEKQKLVSDLKEDVNKQLNELKENTNK